MKIINKIFLVVITILLFSTKVNALTISENNLTIPKGTSKEVQITANSDVEISSIEFTLVFDTYDIPAYFTVNSIYRDGNPNGITHKVQFDEPVSGDIDLGKVTVRVVNNPTVAGGSVNINSVKYYTPDGEVITKKNQSIYITVGEEKEETPPPEEFTDKNLLKEIKSELVKIELKKDVFEYQVTIDNTVKELDLSPVAINDNYKITTTNQKITELTNNEIIITVNDNKDHEVTYKIKVDIEKKEQVTSKDNIDKLDDNLNKKNNYRGKWIIAIIFFSILLIFGLFINKKK